MSLRTNALGMILLENHGFIALGPMPEADEWLRTKLAQYYADRILTNAPITPADVEAQGIVAPLGRKLLIINKRNRPVAVELPPEAEGADLLTVDGATYENPPRETHIHGKVLQLNPFFSLGHNSTVTRVADPAERRGFRNVSQFGKAFGGKQRQD